jgi:hypothetical protein
MLSPLVLGHGSTFINNLIEANYLNQQALDRLSHTYSPPTIVERGPMASLQAHLISL